MFLALFLIFLTLFKLWIARYLPLLGDEAYYNLWSKHLALSYNDHPPMIAYFNWLINHSLGQSEFSIRLAAILCLLLSSWLIYLIGREMFGKQIAAAAAVIFNLIPTFMAGGVFLTPEQPVVIFWLLSTYFAVRLFKTQQKLYWYLLGASLGLGLLSKYTMLLFLPGLILFLILSRENRHWFKRKEFYYCLLIALAIFSPVIVWNFQQGFSSFSYQSGRIGSPHYLDNVLYFFALQILMYSPFMLFLIIRNLFSDFFKNVKSQENIPLLLSCLAFASFVPFLLISPFTMVGGHWTSIAYLSLIPLICAQYYPQLKKPRIWINLAIIIIINILFIGYYAFLYPIPKELKGQEYAINRKLPDYIKSAKVNYVYANQMGLASLVAFYGKTDLYMPEGLWKQFDIWGRPALKKGESLLYFVFDNPQIRDRLTLIFKTVEIDNQKRLFFKESNFPEKIQIFFCRDFKGGTLP